MASAFIGKRGRCDFDDSDAPARSTRSKRRAVATPVAESTAPAQTNVPVATTPKQAVSKAKLAKHRTITTRPSAPVSPLKPTRTRKSKAPIEIYTDEDTSNTCDEIVVESVTTPRHRDVLKPAEALLLPQKVSVTPKHRLIQVQGAETPQTPSTPSRSTSVLYNQARQLFSRSSDPGVLNGRESEQAELANFIGQCVSNGAGGCLYVSGPPGTGKSALVASVHDKHYSDWQIRSTTINCMSIKSSTDLRTKIVSELGMEETNDLQECFRMDSSGPMLVILDEVDRLVDLDLAMLYSLFEWAMDPKSKLILIGIANALDLTDRCLPQFRSRGIRPELLPVLPYSAAQIAAIVTTKLRSVDPTDLTSMPPFLHPTAIQFCAKKIAAQTGDLRKAFDICQRAIDLVEQETLARDTRNALLDSPSKTPLMEKINLSSPLTPTSPAKKDLSSVTPPTYTITSVPRATIAHMAKITSQVFSNGPTQRLYSLNLQQKAVLCSLAALEKRKRALQLERTMYATPSKSDRSAPTTKQLYESYTGLCRRSEMLHPLTVVEFREVISGLETNGLITGSDGKHGTFVTPITPSRTPSRKQKTAYAVPMIGDDRRISSVVGERELRAVLQSAGGELLREIIDGDC